MAKNPQIAALNEIGQSVWFDDLSRELLNSGRLRELIDLGVSGLTSNPTIFKRSIADSSDYDADLRELAATQVPPEQACEKLMMADVAAAADLLRSVFDSSAGGDGYASIEVSPLLAEDAQDTVRAAKEIWNALKRPNVMIKVPATDAGISAIEELLAAGINVNATLIFSVQSYERVALAYIAALERRLKEGLDLGSVSSVASFFVSRVDAICESAFDDLVRAKLQDGARRDDFFGKVGIANSKIAYSCFERLFSGERFNRLEEMGARVQRPLWASTGTKNPALSKTLYVEELAGARTVNTVPPATLLALIGGAAIEPKLHRSLDEAVAVVEGLGALGLDFAQLLLKLQQDGVAAFRGSYEELLAAVAQKMASL